MIVDTRTNGKFRPNDAITRAELASMIAQFAGLESASAAKFNDVGSRYWAAEEIAIAPTAASARTATSPVPN